MNLYESITNNIKTWLTPEDIDWLSTQNHLDKLNEISMNYNATGDIDDDQRQLNDLAVDYFYDEVGIYNERIDSLCTKWAHDQAYKINEAVTNKED